MTRTLTKRDLALSLRSAGRTVEEIAKTLKVTRSEAASLMEVDWYDPEENASQMNRYAQLFTGVLRFSSVKVAEESIARIDSLNRRFVREGDRRGIHQVQLMALIGKNRAEGMGKQEIADLFKEWLITHL